MGSFPIVLSVLTRLAEAAVLSIQVRIFFIIVIDLLDTYPLDTRVGCASAARDGELALRASPALGARAVKRGGPVHRHYHT